MIPRTLLLTSLRHLLRHPWQMGLAILGVALGVAVVVAIDLANESARRAFTISAEAVSGRATDEIIGGPRGVDEELYRRLRVELGLRDSAPLVEGYASAPGRAGLTLRVLGVDPLAEGRFRPFLAASDARGSRDLGRLFTQPGAALISGETARAYGLGLAEGTSSLPLRIGVEEQTATLVGLLEPEDAGAQRALDGILVVDIATAQEWLGSVGRLSRIDLILPDGAAGEELRARIRAALPPDAQLTRPEARTNAITQMTAAFELNLTALSLLALVVGMFLIYNTITFSVVQRRGLFGTLRCLGVTRGQVVALVLAESLAVALVGALAGVALGVALGRGLVGMVAQTINDLYFAVSVRNIELASAPLIKGFALGILTTLIAAAVPALEATFTPPRTVLRRSSYEERVRRVVPWVALGGLLLLATGAGMLAAPGRSLVLSFGGLFAITIGAAAVTPLATLLLMRLAQPIFSAAAGMLGRMAARDVVASLSRTSVAIAALMIAVSVTIGVGLMVGSFRTTVVRWLENTLRADIYVAAPDATAGRPTKPMPPELIDRLVGAPGVERARRYRTVEVQGSLGTTLVVALDVAAADQPIFEFLGGDPAQIWGGWGRGDVLISEPLAFRHGLAVGDTLDLQTADGPRSFRVAGVFYDYGTDRGVVMIDLARYQALWRDTAVASLGLYAAPGVDTDTLVRELRALAGDETLVSIRSNRALRAGSLVVFDRTFAITGVLQLLATIVAFVGILAALMALQLERSRELGVLRANGLTPGQLWGVVLSQTGLIGLTAGLLAIPVGTLMALVLVFVINKRSFGWTLSFQLDAGLFAQALLVSVAAALLAGVYPAWRMGRTAPALALREE
jgi:putative ABC transport system permease protein